jgi:hypothetical protein
MFRKPIPRAHRVIRGPMTLSKAQVYSSSAEWTPLEAYS